MKPWWIETITLDEEGEVTGITAVIDAPYLPILNQLIYPENNGTLSVVREERGATELWVPLTRAQLLDLFRQVRKLTGLPDDEAKNIPGCYDSLTRVVYDLMDRY